MYRLLIEVEQPLGQNCCQVHKSASESSPPKVDNSKDGRSVIEQHHSNMKVFQLSSVWKHVQKKLQIGIGLFPCLKATLLTSWAEMGADSGYLHHLRFFWNLALQLSGSRWKASVAAPHKFSDPDLTFLQLHALSAQVWYSVRIDISKILGGKFLNMFKILAQRASEAYVCGGFYNRACLAGLE